MMDLDNVEEDLPLLDEPALGGGSSTFLAEEVAAPAGEALEEPLLLDSDDEVDADAEKLVQAESRIRELVEQADLESMSTRAILEQLKVELGDAELCDRHRVRLKDYVAHVAEQRVNKGTGNKRRRDAMEELQDAIAKPVAGADLFDGVEAAAPHEDEEEEDEEDFKPKRKGKKKKQKQKEPKKKRSSKREAKESGGAAGGGAGGEDEQKLAEAPVKAMSSVLRAFKETSDALKARSGGRGGVGEPAHDVLLTEAQQLVADMQFAFNKDVESNEQGLPAIARQQMAGRVESGMARAYLGPQLIEAGLLAVLADWLRPLPTDGAQPPASVKKVTLAGLLSLGVDWAEGSALNALKKSGLGKFVMQLYKTEKLPEVTRAAEKLIELWSRPVFSINDDYKTLSAVDERRLSGPGATGQGGSARSQLAAARQVEIQQRVEASRKRPNTRAQLPYAGAELGQAVRRPARKHAAADGSSARVTENAHQLLAGLQLQEEVAREVARAGNRVAK